MNYDASESNLPNLENIKDAEYLILGTSHGRQFSRGGNHKKLEEKLGGTVLNLSQGNGGGGVYNQKFWVDYYQKKGGKYQKVIYFIDPFVFFSKTFDEYNYIFVREPFDVGLFTFMLTEKVRTACTLQYLRSKLGKTFLKQLYTGNTTNNKLCAINETDVISRKKILYPEEPFIFDTKKFQFFVKFLLELSNNNKEVWLVIPPSYPIGGFHGYETLVQHIKADVVGTDRIQFLDHTNSIVDICLYNDHDHLNNEGMNLYLDKFILPNIIE